MRHNQGGFTMIELMVGLVILAILFSVGAPSFMTWAQNSQIRTAAESISAGLQLARAEAVRRNSQVRFQLTDNLGSSCTLISAGKNWVVSMDNPTGLCDKAPNADDAPILPATTPPAPRIIQKHDGSEGTPNALVSSNNPDVTFNGLGRASNATNNSLLINITNQTGGECVQNNGPMRCLNILVATGGQIRMCNPALAPYPTNPQGC